MPAFLLQRLGLFEFHGDGLRLDGLRRPSDPIDAMRIQEQFLFRRVVEDGHLLRADDHQPLLLRGVQPTDEDVPADAALEFQAAQGHVDHAGGQVALAVGLGGDRFFAQEVEDDGDVVGGETPEDVLFGADQAHVEAIGVAVEDPPQRALLDQLAEFHDRRMVEEDVSDHQHGDAALGQRHQFLALPGVQRQGFLDEHVLAGLQAAADQVVMGGGRGGDGHGGQLGIVEHLLEVVGEGRPAGRGI